MRYAICFTPPARDPLADAAARWLGRNVYSGEAEEHPGLKGLGVHEIAFHTARDDFYVRVMAFCEINQV